MVNKKEVTFKLLSLKLLLTQLCIFTDFFLNIAQADGANRGVSGSDSGLKGFGFDIHMKEKNN